MPDVSVLLASRDAVLGARIADALERGGHQARMIADDGEVGDLFPIKQGDASIVVWSNAALKLARLHEQARDALERGALVPVAVGGARAPGGFEGLQPVDLSGWQGDESDPRWRFVLDEISIAAGRNQILDRSVWRAAAVNDDNITEDEEAGEEPPPALAAIPELATDAPRRPRRRKRRYRPAAVAAAGVASLCFGAGMGVILAPWLTSIPDARTPGARTPDIRPAVAETEPPLREGAGIDLAVLQPAPGFVENEEDPSVAQTATAEIADAPTGTSETDEEAAPLEIAMAGPVALAEAEIPEVDATASGDAEPAEENEDAPSLDTLLASMPELNEDAEDGSSVDEQKTPPPEEGVFRDCSACPQMRVVDSGTFMMGTPPGQLARSDDEGPVKQVTIAKSFAIGVAEVTREEWAACVEDGGCNAYRARAGSGGKLPAASVSFKDAESYAAWLTKKTGHVYRLPSEAEWEYAARAGADTPFAWGSALAPYLANYDARYPYKGATGAKSAGPKTAGSYPANPFGLYDMAGNLWEWTADCWASGIAELSADGAARGGNCTSRVLKGGAWNTGGWRLRAGHRIGKLETARENDNGFRVVREL